MLPTGPGLCVAVDVVSWSAPPIEAGFALGPNEPEQLAGVAAVNGLFGVTELELLRAVARYRSLAVCAVMSPSGEEMRPDADVAPVPPPAPAPPSVESWGARLRDGRTALVEVEPVGGDLWRCPTPGAPLAARGKPSLVVLVVALTEGWDVAAILSPAELAAEDAAKGVADVTAWRRESWRAWLRCGDDAPMPRAVEIDVARDGEGRAYLFRAGPGALPLGYGKLAIFAALLRDGHVASIDEAADRWCGCERPEAGVAREPAPSAVAWSAERWEADVVGEPAPRVVTLLTGADATCRWWRAPGAAHPEWWHNAPGTAVLATLQHEGIASGRVGEMRRAEAIAP